MWPSSPATCRSSPSYIEQLFDRAKGHDAAVPRRDEWFQTTQAVSRASAMAAACEEALRNGPREIVAPLFEHDSVVEEPPEETFRNVNTRDELEAAGACLS